MSARTPCEVLAVDIDPRVRAECLALPSRRRCCRCRRSRSACRCCPSSRPWRRLETDHRRRRRPDVHVRHHFVVEPAPAGILPGAHMMPGHAPAGLERRAFFAAERMRAGVGPGVLPGAVVGVKMTIVSGASARMTSMIRPMLESSSIIESEKLPRCDLPCEHLVRVGRLVHLHEVDVHEERLAALGVLLDVVDRRIRLPHIEIARFSSVITAPLSPLTAGLPATPSHSYRFTTL